MGKSLVKGRYSARKKMEAVLRLLRGEDLDTLSRELGVEAHRLSEWRDGFLAAGAASFKSREGEAREAEVKDLKAAIGDLTLRLEVSREAVRRLKGGLPLAGRRSKP